MTSFAARPLLVVALGGNAISPPAGALSYAGERQAVSGACVALADLARQGYRLLVVHGNGPQVGRLLRDDFRLDDLDIHVAQTQGELGYLLAAELEAALENAESAVALVTRAVVDAEDPAFHKPDKPVGPVLRQRPEQPAVWLGRAEGWRRTVASPRPHSVVELPVIRELLTICHAVAGGGGGVPVDATGRGRPAVIDKDRLAALLAVALDAQALLIGTDVDGVYQDFATASARRIPRLTIDEARAQLAAGRYPPGTMGPKVESAVEFASATGRYAVITALDALAAGLGGDAGTRIGAVRQVPS